MTLAGQLKFAGPSFSTSSFSREDGPDLNFSFEVAFIDENRKGRDDETLFRYTLGAEYRLLEDVYLKLSLGTEDGRDDEDDQTFALGRIKLGFNTPTGSSE